MHGYEIVLILSAFSVIVLILAIMWRRKSSNSLDTSFEFFSKDFFDAHKKFTRMVLEHLISRTHHYNSVTEKDFKTSRTRQMIDHISLLDAKFKSGEINYLEFITYPDRIREVAKLLGKDSIISMIERPKDWDDVDSKKNSIHIAVDKFAEELSQSVKRVNNQSYHERMIVPEFESANVSIDNENTLMN